MYPEAFNRAELDGVVPSSSVLNYVSRLRDEPECEEESLADEGVPQKGSGWHGNGEPMLVGVGYVSREFFDGQALASPGHWLVAQRRYPDHILWACTGDQIHGFLQQTWPPELLMKLALGRVDSCQVSLRNMDCEWKGILSIVQIFRLTVGTWDSC